MKDSSSKPAAPAGQSVKSWTAQVGIGYSTYYTIPEELRPRRVKLGKRDLIIEDGQDWLERMAACGGVPTRTAKAA